MSESDKDLVKFLTAQMRYEAEEKRALQLLVAELMEERDKLKDEIRTLRYNNRL